MKLVDAYFQEMKKASSSVICFGELSGEVEDKLALLKHCLINNFKEMSSKEIYGLASIATDIEGKMEKMKKLCIAAETYIDLVENPEEGQGEIVPSSK